MALVVRLSELLEGGSAERGGGVIELHKDLHVEG